MAKNKTNKGTTLRIEISPQTVFMILGIALGLYFLYTIRTVLVIFFFAFILSSTLLPIINKLIEFKFPRWLAVTVVYLGLTFIAVGLLSAVSVPLARESIRLSENLPGLLEKIADKVNELALRVGAEQEVINHEELDSMLESWAERQTQNLGEIVQTGTEGALAVINMVLTFFGGVFTIISVITISIYLTLDHDNSIQALLKQLPNQKLATRVQKLIADIESKLGQWLMGQFALGFNVGVLTWILLTLLGIPYALPLALLAMLLNVIPIFGATLAVVPAVFVAISTGNILQVIAVLIGYILVQQLENNYLSPKMMSNAVGLPPIIVILAILIGAQLWGFVGILLAVPVAGVLHLGWQFFMDLNGDDKVKSTMKTNGSIKKTKKLAKSGKSD